MRVSTMPSERRPSLVWSKYSAELPSAPRAAGETVDHFITVEGAAVLRSVATDRESDGVAEGDAVLVADADPARDVAAGDHLAFSRAG